MTKIVIADAGPLIGLARIKQLVLLQSLYEKLLIPPKVREELKLSSHKPGSRMVAEAIQTGWIRCIPVHSRNQVTVLCHTVDAGEAEAIQLAREQHADLLLIDDPKGRKTAKNKGVTIIGTGGVLVAAKKAGLLNEVKPILTALRHTGYRLSSALCQRILKLAGE
jgi:predicted nucleic acid-binding protein